jgi:hypothetical protein
MEVEHQIHVGEDEDEEAVQADLPQEKGQWYGKTRRAVALARPRVPSQTSAHAASFSPERRRRGAGDGTSLTISPPSFLSSEDVHASPRPLQQWFLGGSRKLLRLV